MPIVKQLKEPIGGGWVAELVQLPENLASIALVTFSRGSDKMHARLDLDKKWFIDALPAGVNFKSCEDVVETVLKEIRRSY